MGQIIKGANGGFSGKAGSVIGSNWRSIDYIRGLPKKSNKPATENQLAQQSRFSLLVAFLGPLKNILEQSYSGSHINTATGYNLAVHYNLNEAKAITGTYPAYSIDFSKMEISRGSLLKPMDLSALSLTPGEVEIKWMDFTNGANAFADDKMVLVLYDPEERIHILSIGEKTRADKEVTIKVPASFSGKALEILAFFMSKQGTCSGTVYGKTVVVY